MKKVGRINFPHQVLSSQTVRVRVDGMEWDIEYDAVNSNRESVAQSPVVDGESTSSHHSGNRYRPLEESRNCRSSARQSGLSNMFEDILSRSAQRILGILLPSGKNRGVSGLKGGLILGMLLGCAVLCLFHQFSHLDVAQQPTSQTKRPVLVTPSMPLISKTLSLPGFRVYAVSHGTYQTRAEANQRMVALAAHSVSSICLPYHGYHVVSSLTVRKQDAQKLATTSGNGANVLEIQGRERTIPILGESSEESIKTTQHWLSNIESALLASAAWGNDHGRISDAVTAVQTALRTYPGDAMVAQTGIGNQLKLLQKSLGDIQVELAKSNLSDVSQSSLIAEKELLAIHGMTTR